MSIGVVGKMASGKSIFARHLAKSLGRGVRELQDSDDSFSGLGIPIRVSQKEESLNNPTILYRVERDSLSYRIKVEKHIFRNGRYRDSEETLYFILKGPNLRSISKANYLYLNTVDLYKGLVVEPWYIKLFALYLHVIMFAGVSVPFGLPVQWLAVLLVPLLMMVFVVVFALSSRR